MIPSKHAKAEVIGGERDGQRLAVVDPRDCLLMLVVQDVDGQMVTDMWSDLPPREVFAILREGAVAIRKRYPDDFTSVGVV